MNEQKYQLILSGQLVEGFELDDAVEKLVQLLRLPEEQVRAMFNGERSVIKKLLDQDKAEHLRQKVVNHGMQCYLEEVHAKKPAKQTAEPLTLEIDDPVQDKTEATPSSGGLELVPMEQESVEEEVVEDEPDDEMEEIVMDYSPQTTPVVKINMHPDEDDEASEEDEKSEASRADSDSELNKGTFFEQPATLSHASATESTKPAGNQRNLIMLGGVLILAGLVWLAKPMLFPDESVDGNVASAKVDTAPKVQAPIDPQLDVSNKRIDQIFRSVKVWMIQYGAGFNPQQVTLERLGRDLEITDEQMRDGWGQPFKYIAQESSYSVISAGKDGQFDTADDLVKKGSISQN